MVYYFGDHFSSDSSSKLNHEHMFSKAYKMLGFINRSTKKFNNPTTIKTIYCSLVRSVLEYGSLKFGVNHIHNLNNIQFKFFLKIAHMKNLSKDYYASLKFSKHRLSPAKTSFI